MIKLLNQLQDLSCANKQQETILLILFLTMILRTVLMFKWKYSMADLIYGSEHIVHKY